MDTINRLSGLLEATFVAFRHIGGNLYFSENEELQHSFLGLKSCWYTQNQYCMRKKLSWILWFNLAFRIFDACFYLSLP